MSIYLGNKTIVNSDMKGPCPDGFHVPLKTEWEAAINVLKALGGNHNNIVSCFKIPKEGYMSNRLSRNYKDQYGFYWSSSASGNNTAYHLMFTPSNILISTGWISKTSGAAIRPFKNESVIPTSSWTKLFGTSIAAGGIFWSASDELISLSSNGTNWITMSDKNLGATSVYNDGDGTSDDKCGYFYEWGNNYGFGWSDTIQSSGSGVNAGAYGPGNYYSSSIFITAAPRDTSNNQNLRGGVTQGTSTVTTPAEIKNLYIGADEVKEVYVGADKVRPKIINFATQGPAPDGFHVPTKDEWVALCGILTNTFLLTGKGNDMKTYLKMPYVGSRDGYNSNVNYLNSSGNYASSTRYDESSAYLFVFDSWGVYPAYTRYYRSQANSIRCFKNSPITPDSSWTTLYDGSSVATGAGIFHNPSLGLISVSGDGSTWYTIMDKNLGATTIYNDGDTLSEAKCGGYFQWGNNYMFPFTGSVTTSSTRVDASTYGPGNYYNSSTFITRRSGPYRWDSTDNGNLRGGVDGNVPV